MVSRSDGVGELLLEARSGGSEPRAQPCPEVRLVEQEIGGDCRLADEVTERAGSTFAALDVNELSIRTEQVAGLDRSAAGEADGLLVEEGEPGGRGSASVVGAFLLVAVGGRE